MYGVIIDQGPYQPLKILLEKQVKVMERSPGIGLGTLCILLGV